MDVLSRNFTTQPQSLLAPPAPVAPAPPATAQPPATSDTASISKSEITSKPAQAPKADVAPKMNPTREDFREYLKREAEKNKQEQDKILNDPKVLEQVKKMIEDITKMR